MADLPEPLVPAEVDVRDLDSFMLNVERLMASELVALSSHEVIAAALFLWCRAWKQVPAASLPDDERVLAAYARLPLARFRKLRDEVMRGFVKCTDGRFYHRVLGEEAVRAYGWAKASQKRREADAKRLREWRQSRGETPNETPNETRFVAEETGQDRKLTPNPHEVGANGSSPSGNKNQRANGANPRALGTNSRAQPKPPVDEQALLKSAAYRVKHPTMARPPIDVMRACLAKGLITQEEFDRAS